ncbi:MAG: YqcC family protein [Saccharospirillum sp.]
MLFRSGNTVILCIDRSCVYTARFLTVCRCVADRGGSRLSELSNLLDELETELRELGYWSDMPPTPEALASKQPFAVDTLTLPEWLQWIYLQRLRALIEADLPLPTGAQVGPYAEEALKSDKRPTQKLLVIIDRIDGCLGKP